MADLSSYINVAANGITTINDITPEVGATPIPNITGFSNISATGNITGAYLAGNGAQITGITSTGTLTTLSVTGTSTLGNISSTGNVNVDGIITVGNLVTSGTGSFGANVNMNGNWLTNIGYAVNNTDAASKQYVDTIVSTGISYHQPVNAATTTTTAVATGGTTAYNEPGGAGVGVGAYISTTGVFYLIDTVDVQTVGTRILVKNEANAAWNGIYTYANTNAIVRATDADEYGVNSTTKLSINNYFFTLDGNINNGSAFIVSAPAGTITFGTSDIVFTTFSSSQVYEGGTGINIAGTVISANASQTQVTAVGTLTSLVVSGNANIGIVSAVGYGTFSNISTTGSGGNINGANVISANSFTATGNVKTGPILTINNTANAWSGANAIQIGTASFHTLSTGNYTIIGQNYYWDGVRSRYIQTGAASQYYLQGNTFTWASGPSGTANSIAIFAPKMTLDGAANLTVNGNIIGTLANGTSNVSIAAANGNVTITSNGNATMSVTDTGVNVSKITSSGNITLSSTGNYAYGLVAVLPTDTASSNLVYAQMGGSDYFRIRVGGSNNAGFVEFATADDGTEPIYFRQYTGIFTTPVRTLTLLDAGGNTSFPGNVALTGGGFITSTGNVNVGNVNTTGLVSSTGNLNAGNIITGGIVSATGNITANFYIGNGSQLTGLSSSGLSNGNSNVNIATSNGNVTITSAGNTTLTVTGTGANVSGTLSVSGNINVGNIGATGGVFTTVGGSLTTASQPNITSTGTLTTLSVSGNASVGNLSVTGTTNFGSTTFGNISVSGNANIGTLNVSGTTSNVVRRAYGKVGYNTTITLDTISVGVAQFTGSGLTANCVYITNFSTNFYYTTENMISPSSTVSLLIGVITTSTPNGTVSQALVSGGDMARTTLSFVGVGGAMYQITVVNVGGGSSGWNISIERLL